jgi:hypothetical protein
MESVVAHQSALTAEEKLHFRLWLQKKFSERCRRNARYSLRSFAKSLEMDPSSLSQILSGKRPISKKMVGDICSRVAASPKELRAFGLLASAGHTEDYFQVGLDSFAIISDWYHFAIVELTSVSGFKPDPRWIGRKLGITAEEAKAAIARLQRAGLLAFENGNLNRTTKCFTNQSNVSTSSAHRELQRQILQKALLAVDECLPEEKDITSMTMAVDESNLLRAREMIRKFRRDLCDLLEDGEQSRVYHLGVQLYPVSLKERSQ